MEDSVGGQRILTRSQPESGESVCVAEGIFTPPQVQHSPEFQSLSLNHAQSPGIYPASLTKESPTSMSCDRKGTSL